MYKILYDSYISLSALLDHNIRFDLVVWKLLNGVLHEELIDLSYYDS